MGGVRLLLKPVLPKGVTVSTGHRDMLRRLAEELCCGRPDKADQLDSKFSVTCQLMRQTAGTDASGTQRTANKDGMKDMWLILMRDCKETCYLCNRPDHHVVEVDGRVDRLLHTKLGYQALNQVKMEGDVFTKGDFVLRVLTATKEALSQQTLIGVVLEVEYLPVTHGSVADPVLFEFVDLLKQQLAMLATDNSTVIIDLMPVRPAYEAYQGLLSERFGRCHAAIGYVEMALTLQATGGVQQQQLSKQQQQVKPQL